MSEDDHAKSQIDGLIRALEREEDRLVDPTAAATPSRAEPRGETTDPSSRKPTVCPIDPTWAEAAVQSCDAFAKDWAAAAKPRLRASASFTPQPPQAMSRREWVGSLDNPGCFVLLQLDPPAGEWVIEIQRSLADGLIDRLLGGDGEVSRSEARPLTDIEVRLIGRLVGDWLTPLAQWWRPVTEAKIRLRRIECDPRRLSLGDWDETVSVFPIEFSVASVGGRLRLALPIAPGDPRLSRLVGMGQEPSPAGKDVQGDPGAASRQPTIDAARGRAEVEVVVTIARSRIQTRELIDLDVGDVITTEQDQNAPLELSLQGVPKFRVHPGVLRDKKAVRLDEPIND